MRLLRPWIIESIVSLDLTLARWARSKSLFLRFGADLAFLHSALLFDLARLRAQRVRTLGRWMMMRTAVLTLLTALALVATPAGHAALISFHTDLSGANEVPPTGSPGIGSVAVTVDDVANTIHIDANFSGLMSPTAVAHIHCCTPPGFNQPVAVGPGTLPGFPVGVTSGTYDSTLNLLDAGTYTGGFITNFGGGTVGGARDAIIQHLIAGETYFNIHTTSSAVARSAAN